MSIDRLSLRERPAGLPIMHQRWSRLLFMHWRVPASALRPLVPADLEIDTFDDTAWLGVTPFTMPQVGPPFLPAPPLIGRTHELNVRTYVHRNGVPGVWFFSLDASNPAAVLGARVGFSLPYNYARISLHEDSGRNQFESTRRSGSTPRAEFRACWRLGARLPEALHGSLAFFLTERYCLYAERGSGLRRVRIHHQPWTLREVELESYSSTVVEAAGLPTPEGEPLLHGQDSDLDVDVWPPSIV